MERDRQSDLTGVPNRDSRCWCSSTFVAFLWLFERRTPKNTEEFRTTQELTIFGDRAITVRFVVLTTDNVVGPTVTGGAETGPVVLLNEQRDCGRAGQGEKYRMIR